MFDKIKTRNGLVSSMSTGLVSLEVIENEQKTLLLVTSNCELVGAITKDARMASGYAESIELAEKGAYVVFDVIRKRALAIHPDIFGGVARGVGSISGYKEAARTVETDRLVNQEVVVLNNGHCHSGRIVAVNKDLPEHYYVVMLLNGKMAFQNVSLTHLGTSADGEWELEAEAVTTRYSWLDAQGKEFFPAANLNRDGFSVPCPMIFVVYDNEDVARTVALDVDGRDELGNQVLHKVSLDLRAVETERYLVANESDVLLLSKAAMEALPEMKVSVSIPVLAYYKGTSIQHITLPSRF